MKDRRAKEQIRMCEWKVETKMDYEIMVAKQKVK